MPVIVGIRREDKNKWERRSPLIPADVARLEAGQKLHFLVQPSPIRIYREEEYRAAGVEVTEDIGPAQIILAVKEVPTSLIAPGKVYAFYAHVVKGQPFNMPMLQRMLKLGCSLVDYERIADEDSRRLIFFGRHAGYAGMVETLWVLGQRLAAEGMQTPLAQVQHAYTYSDLEAAKGHLSDLGRLILRVGLPKSLRPLVIGISGYGNVSRGAQEVLDCLKVREISVPELPAEARTSSEWGEILKVVFREEDMVRPWAEADTFDLRDYYVNPERYRSCFEEYLPCLDLLVNAIYWEERYPRLVTCEWVRQNYGAGHNPRLKVIGDLSCDIEGSIELTRKAATPDSPCYVYDPDTDTIRDGVSGIGPAVMAVDNLPCEFPREASEYFSTVLRDMVGSLAAADWEADFAQLQLPPHLKKAVIVHKGELTPAYRYLQQHIDRIDDSRLTIDG
jgi:hypothetical protein